MFNRLLPPRLDNAYRGSSLAIWLFALLALDVALGQVALLQVVPIVRTPIASIVDLVLLAVTIAGLALWLWVSTRSERAIGKAPKCRSMSPAPAESDR